ncbi:YraN family protein [Puerhibacterium puerhi]|uniref:YraN family protein n=1 Tax=Puerhibacterium puerhi TaxID=2692623 RepID=UPI001358280B|nr:YraN family protein [Puerhibacterium puerhi]
MRAKDAVGRYGEQVAARHLVERGFELLDRNWRGTGGELDVVALDGATLVAVEVKTRRGELYGHPAEAVTPAKLVRLRRLTGQWLDEHAAAAPRRFREVRIDVVAVVLPRAGAARVEHLEGVL